MPKKPPLNDEEIALWQAEIKHVRPLKKPRITAIQAPEIVKTPAVKTIKKYRPRIENTVVQKQKPEQILTEKTLDTHWLRKLYAGNYPIDATLDLHGLTSKQAHDRLENFMDTHVLRGARLLLIITGKGKKNAEFSKEYGVLHQSLPRWLASAHFSGMIMAIKSAHAKHGGDGAYYVVLKRKRS